MNFIEFKKNKERLFIFLLLSTAFLLRLYRLGVNDFWYDEIYSIIISQNFWQNWNPPLYFAILRYWIKLFGVSEFSLRFPSLVFSVISVYFTYILGKKIFNPKVGIFSATLMVFSAFSLWYAQEARPYSLSMLLGIISTYSLYLALFEKKKQHWFIFMLFSCLLVYSDITYFSLLLLFSQLLIVLLFSSNKIVKKILYFSPVFLLFLPRLKYFLSKISYIKEGFWIPVPNFKSLISTIDNFNSGYNSHPAVYFISFVLSCIFLGGCFFIPKINKALIKKVILFPILIFLPILIIYIVSKIFVPVYLNRGMLIFLPYYYILLAVGFGNLPFKKNVKIIITAVFISTFLISLHSYYKNWMFMPLEHHLGAYLKKEFKPAVSFIKDNFKGNDLVAHTNLSSQPLFEFYAGKGKLDQYFLFYPGMIDSNSNIAFRSGKGNIDTDSPDLPAASRLWIISCDWVRDGSLDENSIAVRTELDKKYKRDLSLNFDGLWIYRYVK